jgi:beta-galactosidase
VTFDQTTAPVASPELWHIDHPFLYTAVSKVSDGGKTADNFTTPFGFRWFKWTAEQGFFLNGEHFISRARTCIRITPAGATPWPTADFSGT